MCVMLSGFDDVVGLCIVEKLFCWFCLLYIGCSFVGYFFLSKLDLGFVVYEELWLNELRGVSVRKV